MTRRNAALWNPGQGGRVDFASFLLLLVIRLHLLPVGFLFYIAARSFFIFIWIVVPILFLFLFFFT